MLILAQAEKIIRADFSGQTETFRTETSNCSRRAFGVFTRPSTSCFKTTSSVGVVFIVAVMLRHL